MELADARVAIEPEPQSARVRLLDLALRCGARRNGELPWHLLRHLARTADAETPAEAEVPARHVARTLGQALSEAIAKRVDEGARVDFLVRALPSLWTLDRDHGVDAITAAMSAFDAVDGAWLRATTGAALLRFLGEDEPETHTDAPSDGLTARDLTAIGARRTEGSRGASWPVLMHGLYRHLEALQAHEGPVAVMRWLRLCPSRAALRFASSLDLVRHDPLLLATLLIRGGPREIAVGLAALHRADVQHSVRAAVAHLVAREAVLARVRLDVLFAQTAALPTPEQELTDALLDRALASPGDPPGTVTDAQLTEPDPGLVETALLTTRALGAEERIAILERLLSGLVRPIASPVVASVVTRDGWVGTVTRGLLAAWRSAPDAERERVRQTVMRGLGRIEAAARTQAAASSVNDSAIPRLGLFSAVVLTLARSLPDTAPGRSFSLALYGLALRLLSAGPRELRDAHPSLAAAPDPCDAAQLAAVDEFLRQWRATELASELEVPPPELGPTLSSAPRGAATLPPPTVVPPRRSFLRRLWAN